MDRGAWQATPMGLQRVGHDLATKQQTTGLDFNLKSCGQLLPNLHFKWIVLTACGEYMGKEGPTNGQQLGK